MHDARSRVCEQGAWAPKLLRVCNVLRSIKRFIDYYIHLVFKKSLLICISALLNFMHTGYLLHKILVAAQAFIRHTHSHTLTTIHTRTHTCLLPHIPAFLHTTRPPPHGMTSSLITHHTVCTSCLIDQAHNHEYMVCRVSFPTEPFVQPPPPPPPPPPTFNQVQHLCIFPCGTSN